MQIILHTATTDANVVIASFFLMKFFKLKIMYFIKEKTMCFSLISSLCARITGLFAEESATNVYVQ